MRKILARASLTVKELETVMCRVESTLNSRPITYQYHRAGEPRPLSPNDLLISPDRESSLPPRFTGETMPPDTTRMELTERVKYKQLLFNQFEKRFNDEYLQERARHLKKTARGNSNQDRRSGVNRRAEPKASRLEVRGH